MSGVGCGIRCGHSEGSPSTWASRGVQTLADVTVTAPPHGTVCLFIVPTTEVRNRLHRGAQACPEAQPPDSCPGTPCGAHSLREKETTAERRGQGPSRPPNASRRCPPVCTCWALDISSLVSQGCRGLGAPRAGRNGPGHAAERPTEPHSARGHPASPWEPRSDP